MKVNIFSPVNTPQSVFFKPSQLCTDTGDWLNFSKRHLVCLPLIGYILIRIWTKESESYASRPLLKGPVGKLKNISFG